MKTGSPKSLVLTFWATKSILPLKSFSTISFKPYTLRQINGVPVAIIGQAFPYTPIANPRYFVADWSFGIQEEALQAVVDAARGKGAQLVVLLSHNGMDVDLKLATQDRVDAAHPASSRCGTWSRPG